MKSSSPSSPRKTPGAIPHPISPNTSTPPRPSSDLQSPHQRPPLSQSHSIPEYRTKDDDNSRSSSVTTGKRERKETERQTSKGRDVLKGPSLNSLTGRERFSPILEEDPTGRSPPRHDVPALSPVATNPHSVSTESTKTIKGSAMPQTPSQDYVSTPSYPFPPMPLQPGTPISVTTPALHRPFTALSPTVAPSSVSPARMQASRDRLAPSHVRPSFATKFEPTYTTAIQQEAEGPTPKLGELMLRLQSEPGLEKWWTNTAQVMGEHFGADRATLAIPADSTDVENVPWAQMATYNVVDEDPLSLVTKDVQSTRSSMTDLGAQDDMTSELSNGAREISVESSRYALPDSLKTQGRPKLEMRHSFAGFPLKTDSVLQSQNNNSTLAPTRPSILRTNSNMFPRTGLGLEHDKAKGMRLSSQSLRLLADQVLQTPRGNEILETAKRNCRARILPALQTLEMESDPLLTSAGAVRVLEKSKVVHITREYLDETQSVDQRMASQGLHSRTSWPMPSSRTYRSHSNRPEKSVRSLKRPRSHTSESSRSSSAPSSNKDDSQGTIPRVSAYEDYEQIPASPWAQSPAPSPAVHAEPEVNPFFANISIDEEAFSDNPPEHDYSAEGQLEAIGVDRASSIVHIPLVHPLLSKSKRQPRLPFVHGKNGKKKTSEYEKPAAVQGAQGRGSLKSTDDERMTPIAILSILSTAVPYPVDSSSSLKSLIPHLATSFYNAQQHSNLEKQVAGLSRRWQGPDHNLVNEGSRQLPDVRTSSRLAFVGKDSDGISPPATESITSTSEYSGRSLHSPRSSNAGTPGWESSGPGHHDEQRLNKANRETLTEVSDNYFSPRKRYSQGRAGSGTIPILATMSSPGLNSSTITTNQEAPPSTFLGHIQHLVPAGEAKIMSLHVAPKTVRRIRQTSTAQSDEPPTTLSQTMSERPDRSQTETVDSDASSKREVSPSRRYIELSGSPRRQALLQASGQEQSQRQPKPLRAEGADFAATNPSLPATTTKVPFMPIPAEGLRSPREEEFTFQPPTSSMMRIMIDTGAIQEFIAEPLTGNISWANSKFQTYRNESAAEIRRKPWDTIHYKDQRTFRKLWTNALHTGDQVSHQARLKRFDGQYRWFHIRIVPIKDAYASIKHWHGQAMDIHDQHIAEVNAAREKEKAASESKYRSLANSNPHIIFAASVPDGMTFANSQWLSYSGQGLEEALGFGFLNHVHPDDVTKCQFPAFGEAASTSVSAAGSPDTRPPADASSNSSTHASDSTVIPGDNTQDDLLRPLSYDTTGTTHAPAGTLRRLARHGVIKASKDGQGRLSISTEMRLRSKFDQYRWHLVQGSLIESVNFGLGEAQWIIACADISDQKQIEEELKEANGTLEKETTRKMQFLSTMSHEIRTPLNGIIGNLQFLLNSALDEYQSEWTYGADAAARGMHDLINDILDVSKAEAKMLKLFFDWFHIRSVIEDVFETLFSKANEKNLELCYSVDKSVPETVKGDSQRIRQVLLNLVGNAIKFTQEGEIFVDCTVSEGASHESQAKLESNDIFLLFNVHDTGSGFTEEDAKILFKPYSQIDNSSTRDNGGTGLGLLLCKQMVELHGGKISATSVLGKGSTFTFYSLFRIPTLLDRPKVGAASLTGHTSTFNLSDDTKHIFGQTLTDSPGVIPAYIGQGQDSPAMESSGSSDLSVRSSVRSLALRQSMRSSASSIDSQGTALKLSLPSGLVSGDKTHQLEVTIEKKPLESEASSSDPVPVVKAGSLRPPMFSILIVCPQENTRRTTEDHIQQILPKSIPAQITASGEVVASQKMMSGDEPVNFTHVVLQLNEAVQVLGFMDQILKSSTHQHTCMVIITDQAQKGDIMAGAPDVDYDQLSTDRRLRFLLKPAKPQKFARIFDPQQENALSKDHTRANAREAVVVQKQAFKMFKQVLGGKGVRVLAVEDNKVNMQVRLQSKTWATREAL